MESTEVAEQKDRGTKWFLSDKEKQDAIDVRIKSLMKNNDNNSIVIRIDNEKDREAVMDYLSVQRELGEIDDFNFWTAEAKEWSGDRNAYIESLKKFVTGKKGRVAIVTSAFTTGLDLRTKDTIDQIDLLDATTGEYITEQQYQNRAGRAGDEASFERFYSVESLKKHEDGEVKSVLISKIEKAVENGDNEKATKLYRKLQDILLILLK